MRLPDYRTRYGQAFLRLVLALYLVLTAVSHLPFAHDHAHADALGATAQVHAPLEAAPGEEPLPAGEDHGREEACLLCQWVSQAQDPHADPFLKATLLQPQEPLAPTRDPAASAWFATPFPSRGPPRLLSA